jgi:molecular chaperone DnaK
MSATIDFGIDLGTTNSAIAQFRKGSVEVFRNPLLYGQSTLPSVVAFRKDKIDVGAKAKEYIEKRPGDVVSAFKRKMGTNESYPIRSLGRSVTPVELSAHVLKTLKGFVQSGDTVDAAVITIPASFDTIQANATKQAGEQAGFQQIVLLQEPIAASLAYANKSTSGDRLQNGRWLVYDLGGGTFDVALVEVRDGEMRVIDHEGDNFLGGIDFDRMIVEQFVVPRLKQEGQFEDLETALKSENGRLNSAYHGMIRKAEETKIALSGATSAEIEVQVEDDAGRELDVELTLTRSEFEGLIREHIDRTIEMVSAMLARNGMQASDAGFVLMVGGSTYIPYVRQRAGEVLGIEVNCDIDPTTAIAIGAAYFAGTKGSSINAKQPDTRPATAVRVRTAYHKATHEDSEFFAAQFEGELAGLSYRITRDDGGFDTGIKTLQPKIAEDLPLVPNAFNYFTLTILDSAGNQIPLDSDPIGIAHGKFSVSGQPLPHDISVERDDTEHQDTYLESLFRKNETLPLRRTVTYQLNRTVVKGSNDALRVRVMEGPTHVRPDSNQCIGHLEITGAILARDAVRGSDIEITVSLSESRDLTASAYLAMTDQEFSEVFTPKARSTPIHYLRETATGLAHRVSDEIDHATELEDYEAAQDLKALQREASETVAAAQAIPSDDVTDERYQIEDRLRKLNQRIDEATRDKRLQVARREYGEALDRCRDIVTAGGNDGERRRLDEIISQERAFLSSENPLRIREMTEELNRISGIVLWRTPSFLNQVFNNLKQDASRMNDQSQASNLIAAGQFAIEHSNWERLAEVNIALIDLLPTHERVVYSGRIGF